MINLDRAKESVAIAFFDLEKRIKDEGAIRTTTGAIFDAMRSAVSGGGPLTYVYGSLETDDYWEFVGSGRGPGGMPPVDKIEAWIQRAGLSLNAWAVAKTIAKEGSRDHRLGKPNVFLTAIDAWTEGPALKAVDEASALDLETAVVDVITTQLKRAA